ncbi:hypothetical protein FOB31_01805 [Burkholderia multivorans]|nr:hypothetical protein FOB31_01805 [Burkholderia multivorans]QET38793.1 hypothetical protein FOB30_11860 [Burkholderia multivorans]
MRRDSVDSEPGHGVGIHRHRPGGCSIRHACLLFVMTAGGPQGVGGTSMVDSRHIAINDKQKLES